MVSMIIDFIRLALGYFLGESKSLGWNPKFDKESKKYPVKNLTTESASLGKTEWSPGIVLNQGTEGACVGFAWTHFLLSSPDAPSLQPHHDEAFDFAMGIYREAQKIDKWEDNTYGTSVLAGAKVLKQRGLIQEYRWCFSIDEIIAAIQQFGPVVAGIRWGHSLSVPYKNGRVAIMGKLDKGHAVLIDAYYPNKRIGRTNYSDVFRIKNSWGTKYGDNGSAYIVKKDLEKLIDLKGEFCIGINKRYN